MQNELQILIGVPGSGKSTYAAQLVKSDKSYVKLSRDEFRHMLRDEWYPGEEIESVVSILMDSSIKSALSKGYNVILDNTHCNAKTVKETIVKYGKTARIVLKIIGAELSIKQIKEQNKARHKVVPEEVIDRMYKGFTHIVKNKAELLQLVKEVSGESFTECLPFKQDTTLPKAILVDIDGTVTLGPHNRSPFEWHRVDQDLPRETVLNVIRALSVNYHIVFMSGRDESCRQLTLDWLRVYFDDVNIELYMRSTNDFRKDSIVKEELFYKHITPRYYVEVCLEDRDQMVTLYRKKLGLTVLQVDYGDF